MATRKARYSGEWDDGKVLGCALIDTCVWIDLATEPREQEFVWILEALIRDKYIELIVPQTIVDEWKRNRAKTLQKSRERMTATLRNARRVVQQIGSKKDKQVLARRLDDLRTKVPLLTTDPKSAVVRIDSRLRMNSAV